MWVLPNRKDPCKGEGEGKIKSCPRASGIDSPGSFHVGVQINVTRANWTWLHTIGCANSPCQVKFQVYILSFAPAGYLLPRQASEIGLHPSRRLGCGTIGRPSDNHGRLQGFHRQPCRLGEPRSVTRPALARDNPRAEWRRRRPIHAQQAAVSDAQQAGVSDAQHRIRQFSLGTCPLPTRRPVHGAFAYDT